MFQRRIKANTLFFKKLNTKIIFTPALLLVVAVLFQSSSVYSQEQTPVQRAVSPRGEVFFNLIAERAQALAKKPYQAPNTELPDVLNNMKYEQYRNIRFRPEASLWRDQSPFEVQFFHPGFLYKHPVDIEVVNQDGTSLPLHFDPAMFNYENDAQGVKALKDNNFGFAGFRVHFPINSDEYKDEFLVFQGASYFRLIGPGHFYGLSARGLAIDTAENSGEEFPIFKKFWLVKPQPEDARLVIYALLDSPSVTGAYRFEVHPGAPTEMQVSSKLYARKDIKKLGVAPLTSMFFFGENKTRFFDDFRPEVHDSDGLLVQTSHDEWIWRPLTNPKTLQVTSSMDTNPKGFGLAQRDRNFEHYLDSESHYGERPSMWIEPKGDWGKGRVELVEIPTDTETNDNIVAYWVPEKPLKAGESVQYDYNLRTFESRLAKESLAKVERTHIGWAALPGQDNPPPKAERQFVIDFNDGELSNLKPGLKLKAEINASSGKIYDVNVMPLPQQGHWRVAFKLAPQENKPADMRLFLTLHNQRISEVWNYVWLPNAIQ